MEARPTDRVDYDRIAALYDEPARAHDVDPHLLAFIESMDDETAAALRVLDVGCGTGSQLAANRARLPHVSMVGVDRFIGMLRLARRRALDVCWLQGHGARLPLRSTSCDFATCQFAYPHIRQTPRLLDEVFRVLRPGGRFVMTNIDPWSMEAWAIYRYFPEAFARDCDDFVPVDRFLALMRQSGFVDVSARRDHLPRQETLGDFLAFTRARHRVSQLMAIADEAYAEGLRRLERAAAADPASTITSPFVLVTITGDRPAGASHEASVR